MVANRRIVLVTRPANAPTLDNFKLVSDDINLDGSDLKQGEILVQTYYCSLDPYTRAAMGLPGDLPRPDPHPLPQFKDALAILEIGATFGGRSTGVVLKSKNEKVKEGDLVGADWKWQEYAVFNPDNELTFEILDKSTFTSGEEKGKVNISTSLGSLGVSGSHAFFGFNEALNPKAGETLVVSSAAGNIGIVVGQIGKLNGVKTVGITSGKKAKELEEKGLYDIGVDYRAANGDVEALSKKLKEVCPNGIDVYYDNSRGFISEAVYANLNNGARVYVCGGVSQYNNGKTMSPFSDLPVKEGVTTKSGIDLAPIYLFKIPEARQSLVPWIVDGKLKYFEHITQGFENLPRAYVGMYSGENFGKAIVKL